MEQKHKKEKGEKMSFSQVQNREEKSIIIPYFEIPLVPKGHISPITIYAPLTIQTS